MYLNGEHNSKLQCYCHRASLMYRPVVSIYTACEFILKRIATLCWMWCGDCVSFCTAVNWVGCAAAWMVVARPAVCRFAERSTASHCGTVKRTLSPDLTAYAVPVYRCGTKTGCTLFLLALLSNGWERSEFVPVRILAYRSGTIVPGTGYRLNVWKEKRKFLFNIVIWADAIKGWCYWWVVVVIVEMAEL